MTSITRNLPWFIKDLGVSIVGDKCYVSLVENLNIEDVECLKYSLSKGLGLGIVVGGAVMKVPQLLLILNAKSARGLSLPAYVLETLSYAITLAYSARNHFPFSTYGENLFLTIQNVLITLLIVYYAPPTQQQHRGLTTPTPRPTGLLVAMVAIVLVNAFALSVVPASVLALLQLSTVPMSLFSKVPQIAQNHRARSTGQLSAVAVLAQIGGCAARLFTTAQEVGDPVVSAGFALALLLNVVLGVQMWVYWGTDSAVPSARDLVQDKVYEKDLGRGEKVDIVVPPQSPAATQTAHQVQPASYGRKWARKVD
ncbi:mannose-P-dolichol utilization defect 1 protein [Artomyces pyxidatus]|uniref:Mannose-P-dolichol utilization defect 1 protein n=1 Tax=Artomyces pyxidatus TaxID=48021 RepID=A0ACB8SYX9_9AGAM|nr:mannose-P-dolichol utilization defect 1 protein [Artomyces pyxidatus]